MPRRRPYGAYTLPRQDHQEKRKILDAFCQQYFEDNPFNELIQDVRAGRKKYSLHRTTLDDALSDGLYKTICRTTGQIWTREKEEAWRAGLIADYGDGANEELFCIPSKSSGAYLTRPLIESCMEPGVPVLRWTPPAKDFVDWPLGQAEKATREWLDEHVGPLLAVLPQERKHYFGQDFGCPATSQSSGQSRKRSTVI